MNILNLHNLSTDNHIHFIQWFSAICDKREGSFLWSYENLVSRVKGINLWGPRDWG